MNYFAHGTEEFHEAEQVSYVIPIALVVVSVVLAVLITVYFVKRKQQKPVKKPIE